MEWKTITWRRFPNFVFVHKAMMMEGRKYDWSKKKRMLDFLKKNDKWQVWHVSVDRLLRNAWDMMAWRGVELLVSSLDDFLRVCMRLWITPRRWLRYYEDKTLDCSKMLPEMEGGGSLVSFELRNDCYHCYKKSQARKKKKEIFNFQKVFFECPHRRRRKTLMRKYIYRKGKI